MPRSSKPLNQLTLKTIDRKISETQKHLDDLFSAYGEVSARIQPPKKCRLCKSTAKHRGWCGNHVRMDPETRRVALQIKRQKEAERARVN